MDLEVSVVIPTRDRPTDLLRCLQALTAQTSPPREIIVVDNGENDASRGICDRFHVTRIYSQELLSKLFNVGWKAASGNIIAYLNDDSEPAPNWVERISNTFRGWPDAMAVGGPTIDTTPRKLETLYHTRPLGISIAFALYERVLLRASFQSVGKIGRTGAYSVGTWMPSSLQAGTRVVDHLTITNVAFKRSILEEMGGFDENFWYNHIDGDFFRRLRLNGYTQVFDPSIVVSHHVASSGPTRNSYGISRDSTYFFLKDFAPSSLDDFLSMILQLAFLNGFWIYSAITDKTLKPLRGLQGFFRGVCDALLNRGY